MGAIGEYLAAFDFQLYLQHHPGVIPNAAKQLSFRGREISDFFDGLKKEGLNGKVKIDFDSILASGFEDFRMESGRVVIERDGRIPLELRLSPERMMVYAAPDPMDSYGVLYSRKGSKDGFMFGRGRRFALVYPFGSRLNDSRYQGYAVSNIKLNNLAPGNSKSTSHNSAIKLCYAIHRRIKEGVVEALEGMYDAAGFSRISIGKSLVKEPGSGKVKGSQVEFDFDIIPPSLPFIGPSKELADKWTRFLLAKKLPYTYCVAASDDEKNGTVKVSILVDLPE